MATAKEHGKILLAGILPKKLDRLTRLRTELTEEHFADDPVQSMMFQFLERFLGLTGGVLTRAALEDILRKVDAGRRSLYLETYDELAGIHVDDADFEWSIDQIRELTAEKNMKETLTEGMTILTKGATSDDGEEVRGQEAARTHVLDRFADIDRSLSKQEAPQGDMRDEGASILAEYESRKALRLSGAQQGVNFGITELDTRLGGLQPGELILSAGYSSDGKTSLCVQLAWSAVVEQGKNVLFLTTETIHSTVRRKIIARHTRHPKFADYGIPEGLNTYDLKSGNLNDHQEAFLQGAVHDFTSTKDYGRLVIAQLPRGASIETAEAIMMQTQRLFNIDLTIWDYLALFRASAHRSTDRESMSGIIKEAKQVSTTFNKGKGVPLISPWQVNRSSREDAEKIGMYTSKALAETAEATNSADVIISLLAPVDNTNRYAEITMQILKNRDGQTANGLVTQVDYATSFFASRESFASLGSSLTNFTDTDSGLDSLLD